MSAWITRAGSIPSRASSSRRRGLADARIREGAVTPVPLLRPRAAATGHEAVGDARLGQVVGGKLAQHLVADEHADAVLAHPAGGVTENLVAVFELHPEHRIRQQFHHLAAHFEEFFFGHAVSVSLRERSLGGRHSGGLTKRKARPPQPRAAGHDTSATFYYPRAACLFISWQQRARHR